MFGPDVVASVTTAELRQLVDGVRFIEKMRANPVEKDLMADELETLRRLFGKSVVARVDLPAGTVVRAEYLTTKKPGTGIPAARLSKLIGSRLRRDISADELILETDVEWTTSVEER
jgi:N,N'-diacetyllegionaminate synthase